MKYLAIILLVGFAGMSLLGFVGMPHQMTGHADSDCLASFVSRVNLCPDGSNPFSYVFYHIQAYQFFSIAVLGCLAVIFELVASAFILTFAFKNKTIFHLLRNQMAYLRKRMIEISDSLSLSFRNLIRWLSILENSPSF